MHEQRRADEQTQIEADKVERRKAAEENRTYHGHPCPLRAETPVKTRKEIAADLFERGAAVTLHHVTRGATFGQDILHQQHLLGAAYPAPIC